ncbi:MAG: hypothetical protein J5630_00140 [Bacteroidaceae bacterium]|nr:hypothetical protein [Bacteroidaceae bacterium]
MKKQYIEPSTAIFTFNSIHMVAQSSADISGDASGEYTGGDGGGNNDSREDIFSDNRSIWDNAW